MSYESFKGIVLGFVEKAGGNIKVRFYHENETGRHVAKCSDGTEIVGNSSSLTLSVRWNRRAHEAVVAC